jgi:hypothetical protein
LSAYPERMTVGHDADGRPTVTSLASRPFPATRGLSWVRKVSVSS